MRFPENRKKVMIWAAGGRPYHPFEIWQVFMNYEGNFHWQLRVQQQGPWKVEKMMMICYWHYCAAVNGQPMGTTQRVNIQLTIVSSTMLTFEMTLITAIMFNLQLPSIPLSFSFATMIPPDLKSFGPSSSCEILQNKTRRC